MNCIGTKVGQEEQLTGFHDLLDEITEVAKKGGFNEVIDFADVLSPCRITFEAKLEAVLRANLSRSLDQFTLKAKGMVDSTKLMKEVEKLLATVNKIKAQLKSVVVI